MIDVDLSRAANAAPSKGRVRQEWTGGKIQIDETKFLDLVVRAAAITMSANLSRGLRPDGSAAMPGRKKDGRPRGMGSAIAGHLTAISTGALEWVIAAHHEIPGHLKRIMQDVPLLAPPMATIRAGVHAAFLAAVRLAGKVQGVQDAAAFGDVGSAIDRSSNTRALRRVRRQFATSLKTLGVTSRSRMASRLRKLGRHAVRGR